MPDVSYPYAVKYKGRYYTAGEMIYSGDSHKKAVSDLSSEDASRPVKPRKNAKKKETGESEEM